MQHYFPETMANLIKLCANAKYDVSVPENQTCCGLPYFEKGELKTAKSIGELNISLFSNRQIISGSPKCFDTFSLKYPKIFNNTVSHNESMTMARNTLGLPELFSKLTLNHIEAVDGIYYFIPACQGSGKNYTAMLSQFKAATWVLPQLHATCCGAGTCMPTTNHDYAVQMAHTLLKEAVDSGVDFIVTEDDICRRHIENVAGKEHIGIKTLHIIDLFAQAL